MAVAVILLAGGVGCRNSDRLQVQEAEARLRTCVGWMETIAGRAIVDGAEDGDPVRPTADWRTLRDDPDGYYAEVARMVSIRHYLEVAEGGQRSGSFRNNHREFRAACPPAKDSPP